MRQHAVVPVVVVACAAWQGCHKSAGTGGSPGSRDELGAIDAGTDGGSRTAPRALPQPPIPAPGPLSAPRSLTQVGAPRARTRAAIPRDNPQTPGKIALGERLFFDGRLSADGTVACASCHDPEHAFTDARPTSIGIHGQAGQRNAPTILNALYNKTQFWDGRARTLEDQAALPIVNPIEMGQPSVDAAVARLASIPAYQEAFRRVFGGPPRARDLLRALASYERTQVSFDAPFDHFMAGEKDAVDDAVKRGWALFNGAGRCNLCHALTSTRPDVTTFTDDDFHNIGIGIIRHDVVALARQAEQLVDSGDPAAIDRAAIRTDLSALGRFLVTKKSADTASFKTPDVRNVVMTAPYMHDGSFVTLWDVMDHYNKGDGAHNPFLDEDIRSLALEDDEIDDLIALMASLTSPDYALRAAEELARQRAIARTSRPQRDTARAFAKPRQKGP